MAFEKDDGILRNSLSKAILRKLCPQTRVDKQQLYTKHTFSHHGPSKPVEGNVKNDQTLLSDGLRWVAPVKTLTGPNGLQKEDWLKLMKTVKDSTWVLPFLIHQVYRAYGLEKARYTERTTPKRYKTIQISHIFDIKNSIITETLPFFIKNSCHLFSVMLQYR